MNPMPDAATAATVSDGHEPTNAIDPTVGPERVAVRFSLDPVPEPDRGPDPAIAAVDHGLVPEPSGVPLDHLPAPVCAESLTTVDDLTAFFDGGAPMIGADYQRVHPLPDGRQTSRAGNTPTGTSPALGAIRRRSHSSLTRRPMCSLSRRGGRRRRVRRPPR
jgi:hypothetical protein